MSSELKTNSTFKVSIITPFYNAQEYLQDSIHSVLHQTYSNWELLLINDGSIDNSEEIIHSFNDPRIRYFKQSNKGVSAARNVGLDKSTGDFVCFLDADDVFTPNSLEDRINIFKLNPKIHFVDGIVNITRAKISEITKTWQPTFKGYPKKELLRLRDTCFVTGSWMIRKSILGNVRFREGLSHSEDLLFLIEISDKNIYDFTNTPILYFRRTGVSAMSNLKGLANGYMFTLAILTNENLFLSLADRYIYKLKMIKIMVLSYISARKWQCAFHFFVRGILQ